MERWSTLFRLEKILQEKDDGLLINRSSIDMINQL